MIVSQERPSFFANVEPSSYTAIAPLLYSYNGLKSISESSLIIARIVVLSWSAMGQWEALTESGVYACERGTCV